MAVCSSDVMGCYSTLFVLGCIRGGWLQNTGYSFRLIW